MNSKSKTIDMKEGEGIRTAVDLFIINNKREVLLGLRKSVVGRNQWAFPGGHQKTNETFLETAKRELKEELGNNINVKFTQEIIAVRENRLPPFFIPHVTVILLAYYYNGELELPEKEKNKQWKWYSLDNVPKNIFSKGNKIIENYKKKKILTITDFHFKR